MDVLLRMRPLSGWIRHDLDGVVVEKHGLVVAGALVRQNTRIPSGEDSDMGRKPSKSASGSSVIRNLTLQRMKSH